MHTVTLRTAAHAQPLHTGWKQSRNAESSKKTREKLAKKKKKQPPVCGRARKRQLCCSCSCRFNHTQQAAAAAAAKAALASAAWAGKSRSPHATMLRACGPQRPARLHEQYWMKQLYDAHPPSNAPRPAPLLLPPPRLLRTSPPQHYVPRGAASAATPPRTRAQVTPVPVYGAQKLLNGWMRTA